LTQLYNIEAHAWTYEVTDTLISVVMVSEKSENSYRAIGLNPRRQETGGFHGKE